MVAEELRPRHARGDRLELEDTPSVQIGNRVAQGSRKRDRVVRSQPAASRHRGAAELLAHEDSVESFLRGCDRATMSLNMTPACARSTLADAVLCFHLPEEA